MFIDYAMTHLRFLRRLDIGPYIAWAIYILVDSNIVDIDFDKRIRIFL